MKHVWQWLAEHIEYSGRITPIDLWNLLASTGSAGYLLWSTWRARRVALRVNVQHMTLLTHGARTRVDHEVHVTFVNTSDRLVIVEAIIGAGFWSPLRRFACRFVPSTIGKKLAPIDALLPPAGEYALTPEKLQPGESGRVRLSLLPRNLDYFTTDWRRLYCVDQYGRRHAAPRAPIKAVRASLRKYKDSQEQGGQR